MNSSLNLLFSNKTGLADDKVFVTFQNPQLGSNQFNVTYGGGTPVTLAAGDLMSESLNLKEIGSGGLTVEQVNGAVIFISYGKKLTAKKSAPSFIGSTGDDYGTPFQPFELTRMGHASDQGDLTAINYFTAPQSITSYHGGVNGTQLQQAGYNKSAAEIAGQLAAISPGCVIKNKKSGDIVRYMGPSSYPPPGGSHAQQWPSFTKYLQSIHQAGQETSIKNHNAFANDGKNYDFALDLKATVHPDGTIKLDGEITTEITSAKGKKKAGRTFENASILIPNSPAGVLDYVIYGQVNYNTIAWGSGWTELKSYADEKKLSGAYETTRSLAIGEVTTGLLLGCFNSPQKVEYDGKLRKVKDMSSEEWWQLNPMLAFHQLQPNNPDYYNQYANVIYTASNNQAYSIPYSDRLGDGPLVNSVEYNGKAVDTWVVGLEAPVPSK